MPKLVIVESPAKAKTIGKYLGRGYKVTASMGHVRDLPASTLGIDVENGYTPKYITIKGKQKLVKELMASPSRSGSVASRTPSHFLASAFSSLTSFCLPLMVIYFGAKPLSTSMPSWLAGRSRTWPMLAVTL